MSKANYPNPSGETVCCSQCGRDTKNKTGICSGCGGRGRSAANEQLGRSSRSSQALGGAPREMTDAEEEE